MNEYPETGVEPGTDPATGERPSRGATIAARVIVLLLVLAYAVAVLVLRGLS